MDTPPDWSRRALLSAAGLAGLGSLAGCLGSLADAPAVTGARDASAADADGDPTAARCLTDFLDGANGYDGHTERFGPEAEPTVTVGASPEGSDSHLAFDPPSIRVPPETTVEWHWTGYGGPNNVVALDGAFDSGAPVDDAGATFEHTFDSTGVYRYVSESSSEAGMRGVVTVAEPPASDYPAVDDWLVNVEGYDGTFADYREFPAVTVTVGSAASPDAFDFAPPAMKVSTGTEVRWVWTGDGGPHNVVFEDADVSSEALTPDPGVHLSHTFAETGVYRYGCEPHESLGQRGAVVVE